ncbi:sterol desaturase family protein [Pleomorphovibrio marinus]|uniref:sterol desaturase family protein n=1 Tax=Pleomorphovibrio marinus TaxID=2164132 RepID=UPI000E0BB58A|nr:sterol desaturase family protein [Pleomorphovibrio marinus]
MYAVMFVVLGFVLMEISGWFIHKYIMHGPLWNIHKTHHQHNSGIFELNDLFSLAFGLIAVVLILLGVENLDARFWIGIGISLYGMSYFVIHDILIHRRKKWMKKPKSGFLMGLFRAHQAHHVSRKRDDAVSFGLFFVPLRYFKNKK